MIEEVSSTKLHTLPGMSVFDHLDGFRKDWHYMSRFLGDCVERGGVFLIVLWILSRMIIASSPAVSLYLNAQLMNFIETLIRQEQGVQTVGYPEFYRISGSMIIWRLMLDRIVMIANRQVEEPLQNRVNSFFEEKLLQAKARLDLPTLTDPIVEARFGEITPDMTRDQGWSILLAFAVVPASVLSILSQVTVLYGLIRAEGGGWFALFVAVNPIFEYTSWVDADPRVVYVHLVDPILTRMREMKGYIESSYIRRQLITDGLQSFIQEEYHRAMEALGSRWNQSPRNLYDNQRSQGRVFVSIASTLVDEAPTILFAFQSLHSGRPLPLASLTLISGTVSSIAWQLRRTAEQFQNVTSFHKNVKALYDIMEWENQIKDGELSYPKHESTGGMKIEFKSVTFRYPREDETVLSDLSFVIQPGQLCVIVGENGCGKTSTVSLLGRLYDATEGEILIDDVPIQEWKGDDLRRAQAVLSQDFQCYSSTVGENIGYGDVNQLGNRERIRACAEAAGALSFIEKQPDGFDSKIYPQWPEWRALGLAKPNGPIQKKVKELERTMELSGGQWQRLAIARAFMRIIPGADEKDSPNTKLLCFDEPSSALDPKAEFELFEKLRAQKGKKTLIFITHRFGHLTKHADIILYMRDGRVAEQGTHTELMNLGGSYAQLYNVQAQAFQ
ncbi:P-loop containing nucleoside triphosphate hydrolase protein [Clavulina sp. PMI_390]|nr:P-loop containing nucleoside triphosphate hydrolase protein [Clavulina sp. PMI_390]